MGLLCLMQCYVASIDAGASNEDNMESSIIGTRRVTRPVRQNIDTKEIGTRKEAAQYIADMSLELRNLAKANRFISLQGLLEVAYYEAFSATTNIEIPAGEIEHLKELSRATQG